MNEKILFTAHTLDVGGIETALVSLLNEIEQKYDITLVLEKKEGILLSNLSDKIKIVEYKPCKNKNVIIRKFVNLFKRIIFFIKYKNKYKFAASYATYSKMGSFCARTASKNNALWVHTDYFTYYNNDETEVKKFLNFIKYDKFKNIICVSEVAKINLEKVLRKTNIQTLNNLIDYKKILTKSRETIEIKEDKEITTFLNVSRHEERTKKLTRLIEAAEILKKDNIKFRILLIGDGDESSTYREMVSEKDLGNYIFFLGQKSNPYPYFKISDCFLLTSDIEGYPVVFNECMVLNLPIITTNVSDAKKDIEGKYGIVTKKDTESIYNAMKSFITNGYNIQNKFEPGKYNDEILNKLEKIINGGNNA